VETICAKDLKANWIPALRNSLSYLPYRLNSRRRNPLPTSGPLLFRQK